MRITKTLVLTITLWIGITNVLIAQVIPPNGTVDGVPLAGDIKLWLDGNDIDGDGVIDADLNALVTAGLLRFDGTNHYVATWKDKSGNAPVAGDYDVTQATAANQPLYLSGSGLFNGNSVLDFDGTDNLIKDITDWSGAHTVFIAVTSDITNPVQYESFFSNDNTNLNNGSMQIFFEDGRFKYLAGSPAVRVDFEPFVSNELKLFAMDHNGTSTVNTYSDNTLAATNTSMGSKGNTFRHYRLNVNRVGDRLHDSKIAEVLIYDRVLTACERAQVSYYLGEKYGRDYINIASNYGFGATHPKAINGIGLVNLGCTNNTSLDVAVSDAVRLSNASSNDVVNEFLTLGHDNAGYALVNTDVPAGVTNRITQTWKIDEDGDLGTVDVSFDLSFLLASYSNHKLLVDTDGDGDFSNAIVYSSSTVVDGHVQFSNINLNDGDVISLGTGPVPGGVSTNLQLWLRADSATSTTINGAAVNTWTDLSGKNNHFTQAANFNDVAGTTPNVGRPLGPDFYSNDRNFNPSLSFDAAKTDGSSNLRGQGLARPWVLGANATMTAFMVHESNGGNGNFLFNQSTNSVYPNFNISSNGNFRFAEDPTTLINLDGTATAAATKITRAYRSSSNTESRLFWDGSLAVENLTEPNAPLKPSLGDAAELTILGYQADGFTDGNIRFSTNKVSEVLLYDIALTPTQASQVESYLALKYGVWLNTGTSNYLASDGATIWNAATAGVYTHDIFGIGRDDGSALDQRISTSQEADDILTVALDANFTAANTDLTTRTTAFSADRSFMVFANNDGVTTVNTSSTELYASYKRRIDREWQVQATNFSQPVNLKFDGFDDSFVLVRDADGDFSAGASFIGFLDANGEITNVSLADGEFLTLMQVSPFLMTVKTDNPGVSGTTEFKIETDDGTAGYNYNVDCNNDGTYEATSVTGDYTCMYAAAGTYQVAITDNVGDGTGFPRFFYNDASDEEKILSIDQWGSLKWAQMGVSFYGASNLVLNATDTPDLTGVSDFSGMFRDNSSLVDNGGQMNNWDMSSATMIDYMFSGATVFNQDIGSWDVSNARSMNGTFRDAEAFNQNIDTWNTANVEDMQNMFFGAKTFNQDLNSWDVRKVTFMENMFREASVFDGNITSWETGAVLTMANMFFNAHAFNQDISYKVAGGNQGGDAWDVGLVTNFSGMFASFSGVGQFNQAIGNWNTSSAIDMSLMFARHNSFNHPLNDWDVSNVRFFNSMFASAAVFNQPLNQWVTSSAETMAQMFGANGSPNPIFNQDISSWDVSGVNNFSQMFRFNGAFNQDISGWNTGAATNMLLMFIGASAFNQNLGNWDMTGVTNVVQMLNNSGLSVSNYDKTLIGWDAQTLQSGLVLGAAGLQYCAAEAERQNIITSDGWTITDAGKSCYAPGGVTTDLSLWLRADRGVTQTAGAVSEWADQGEFEQDFISVGATPAVETAIINFNPAISFNPTGANTGWLRRSGFQSPTNQFSFFQALTRASGAGAEALFSYVEPGGAHAGNSILFANPADVDFHWRNNNVTYHPGEKLDNEKLEIFNADFDIVNTRLNTFVSGKANASNPFTAPSASLGVSGGTAHLGTEPDIGETGTLGNYFLGDMGEVVLYNRVLTTIEQLQVNSYLALKYGVHLDQTTATPYLASDGTKMWDETVITTYNHDIFGIGRDDASGLNQKVSTSQESDILTVALDNDFVSSNIDATRSATFSNDLSFLTFANDAEALSLGVSTEFSFPYVDRIAREWQVQATNFSLPVNLKFEGIPTLPSGRRFLVRSTDGDFSNEIEVLGELDAAGEIQDVVLQDGDFITVLYAVAGPGGVNEALALWLMADRNGSTLTDGAAISTWEDLSGMGNHATPMNAITFEKDNANDPVNFNPSMSFNGSDAYLTLRDGTLPSEDGSFSCLAVMKSDLTQSFNTLFSMGKTRLGVDNNGTGSFKLAGATMLGANALTANQPAIVTFTYDHLMDSAAIFSNEKLLASSPGVIPDQLTDTLQTFGVTGTDALQDYLGGQVAEIIVFKKQLTAEELRQVWSYLAVKYGISLPLQYLDSQKTPTWNPTG